MDGKVSDTVSDWFRFQTGFRTGLKMVANVSVRVLSWFQRRFFRFRFQRRFQIGFAFNLVSDTVTDWFQTGSKLVLATGSDGFRFHAGFSMVLHKLRMVSGTGFGFRRVSGTVSDGFRFRWVSEMVSEWFPFQTGFGMVSGHGFRLWCQTALKHGFKLVSVSMWF